VQGLRRQRYVLRAGEKEFFDARRCRGQYVRSTAGIKEATRSGGLGGNQVM
jgi:hypothetical protein